jgi:polysaccharide biosynthesis/export protein
MFRRSEGTIFAVLDWSLIGKSATAFGEVSVCSILKRTLRFVVLGTSIAILLGLAGCTNPSATSLEFAAVSTAPRTYVLRPNDQIRVQVYNEPTISGDYKIDGSGAVSIPLAGRLRAAGLTAAQLERSIVQHVDGSILKDPHVNVQVSTYGPFFVRGEVKQPGQFPYAPGLTIGDAVAMAGGYTYRANETAAFVRPSGGTLEVIRPLTTDVPVSPGDNIRIPERYF